MNEYPGLDRLFLWEWSAQFASQRQRRPLLPSTNSVTTNRAGETRSSIANGTRSSSGHPPSAARERLSFLSEKDGAPHQAHGRHHIQYLVEWRVELDNRIIATQSEPNVAVSPSCYWRHVLKSRLEQVVRRTFAGDQQARHDHTMVVVSVTDHTQGDLTKKYAGMEIDWAAADKHLLDWSSYFLKGNALRVTLTFKFVAPNPNSVHRPVTPRGDGGRNVSAGGRTPSPRSPKSSTAPEQRGRPPFLYDLCTFARCPTSCALGPYCLVNSKGIHHPVTPESFKLLEAHATHYGMPATFIDLPLDLQRQLVMDRQARVLNTVPTMPVKIGDMATAQLPQAQPMGVHVGQDHSILRRQSDGDVPQRRDLAGPQGDASILRRQSDGAVLQRKDVTGVHHDASTSRCQPDSTGPKQREPTAVHDATVQSPQTKLAGVTDTAMRGQQTEPAVLHDDELRDYDTWQQSRVRAPWLKAEFAKAFNVAVRNGLSLDLLYENPDPRIFIDQEVHEGVACYFCRRKDIDKFRDRKRRLPGDTGVGEDQT